MNTLETLARLSAILAGLLMTAIALITCGSLIGRNTIGVTLVGDYELTAITAGVAVALFLPWCQLRRGNIIVDFFTARVPTRVNAALDRFGALMLAAVMSLLTWRTAVGGVSSYASQTTTMMLAFPEWVVYAAMVPPLCLTAAIALHQSVIGTKSEPDR